MSTPDVDNVLGGPAKVQKDSLDIGHTQGGMTINISPQTRPVMVDQYGSSEIQIRHTGDQVRATVSYAEWAADTLLEVYELGENQTALTSGAYLGIGATAGALYTDGQLDVIPFLAADAAKLVRIHRAAAVGDLAIAFNNDDDRIFEVEYAGMVDETQADGRWIAQIFLN